MGISAYNRGSGVIRRQIDAEERPVEFEIMDRLNALPKFTDAGTPLGPVHFVFSHGGFWAECPKSGFGFWYSTLSEAVRRWRVRIVSREFGAWKAEVA